MFSIATVYWGNNENLESFINDCLEYSDDVVVAYIDLFEHNFNSDKATIVNLPYNFLLEHGYAAAYNVARSYAKHRWVYNLGVSERITYVNDQLIKTLPTTKYSAFIVRSDDLPGTWYRFGNLDRSTMAGRIHEELCSIELMGRVAKRNGSDVISSWKKVEYFQNNDFEKNVSDGYRLLSRVKWLAGFSDSKNQVGPSDFWWTHYDNELATNLYKQVEDIYTMSKKDMINALSERSDWRDYPV